jgi:hypothetical protein
MKNAVLGFFNGVLLKDTHNIRIHQGGHKNKRESSFD